MDTDTLAQIHRANDVIISACRGQENDRLNQVDSLSQFLESNPDSGTAVNVCNLLPFAANISAAITAILVESRPPVMLAHGTRRLRRLVFAAVSRCQTRGAILPATRDPS